MTFVLRGIPVSEGIGIGRARLVVNSTLKLSDYTHVPESIETELQRFDQAIESVREELNELHSSASLLPNEFSMFLMLHRMLLDDALFTGSARQMIEEQEYSAEKAIVTKALDLMEQLDGVEDSYFRERRADVRQITERVLKALSGSQSWSSRESEEPAILVAHDLFPSDTLLFKKQQKCHGIATDTGGTTSHTAILGRGMNLPTVVGIHNAKRLIKENDWVIVDGFEGIIIVNPDDSILEYYTRLAQEFEKKRDRLKVLRFANSITRDQVSINLMGNIDGPGDIPQVKESGANGIGLFRSEFLFLDRTDLPEEDEQFEIYREVAIAMNPAPITIRTLDLGADKFLDQVMVDLPKNPALGQRGIRFLMAESTMFMTQLRAMFRASIYGNLHIMFPMVTSRSEIFKLFTLIERAKASLEESGLQYDPNIKIGAMVEVPAMALTLPLFAGHFDFFSIGSNDLAQYMLAVDRCDSEVAHLYDPTNLGVLRIMSQAIKDAHRMNTPISICGEIAGDTAFTPLLIGLGARSLSMHAANILKVKENVLMTDADDCRRKVDALLSADDPETISRSLESLHHPFQ